MTFGLRRLGLAATCALVLGACSAGPDGRPSDTGLSGSGADAGPPGDARRPDADSPPARDAVAPPSPDADSPPARDAVAPSSPDADPPPLDSALLPTDAPSTPSPDAAAPPPVDASPPPADTAPSVAPDAALPVRPDPTGLIFDLTRLHTVDVVVAEADLEALENDRENRVPCDVTYDGIALPNSGIRQKGGLGSVSSLGAKPGFSLKFDEFDEDQDLFGMERLILNNAIQDRTFLHEHIGYELARQLGLPAQRTAHAVLTLNGYVYGIFVVAEPVDGDFLRRWFGPEQADGNLYEGPCCADFVGDIDHMELKDEVEDGRSRDDLIDLQNIVRDSSDADFPARVSARLDLRNFILGYAFDAAVYHWDGYAFNLNNHYIYHRPSDDRFVFLPHGMDQILQDVNFDPYAWPNGRLSQRIRENPAFDGLFRDAVRHIASHLWDVDFVRDRVEAVRRVLSQAPRGDDNLERDLRWFEENLEAVVADFARRKAVLLGAVAPPPPEPPPEPVCTPADRAGEHYVFCSGAVDVPTARADCANRGGLLGWPENDRAAAFFRENAAALSGGDTWIGVDDEAEEGVWRHADGTAADFVDWAPDRPNGAEDQNCALLDFGLDGGWNDRDCAELHGYVCRLP